MLVKNQQSQLCRTSAPCIAGSIILGRALQNASAPTLFFKPVEEWEQLFPVNGHDDHDLDLDI